MPSVAENAINGLNLSFFLNLGALPSFFFIVNIWPGIPFATYSQSQQGRCIRNFLFHASLEGKSSASERGSNI